MASFPKDNASKSSKVNSFLKAEVESQFTGDDSLNETLSNSFHGSNAMFQDNSLILKENFNSLNSTDNITFAHETFKKSNKQKQNLAYSICSRFPSKIKKQVEAIIDYYEDQLQSQRQMFWRMTEKSKIQKHQAVELAKLQKSNFQQCSEKVPKNTFQKDNRINALQDKLLQKDKKITDLTKEITTLMVKCTKLKKQLSSTNQSLQSSRKTDRVK